MMMLCSGSRRDRGGRLPIAAIAASLLALGSSANGAEGAALQLFHGRDDTRGMSLKNLRVALDGKDLGVPVPIAEADPERPLFSRNVEPGVHHLEVEASLEASGSTFSYMDGYRVRLRAGLDVEVLAGKGIAVRSQILPRGGITTQWGERNKFVLTVSAVDGPTAPAVVVAKAEPVAPAALETPASREPERAPLATGDSGQSSAPARPADYGAPAPRAEPDRAAPLAAPRPEPDPVARVAAPRPEPDPVARVAAPRPEPDRAARVAAPRSEPDRATRIAAASSPAAPERSTGRPPATASVRRVAPEPAPSASGECRVGALRFEFDQASLADDARETLDRFASCVAATRFSVRVEGHSDSRGRDEYNRWLAWDRAASVSAYLREHGVADRRITTRSHGARRQLCQDATEDCFARNRRVEVVIAR